MCIESLDNSPRRNVIADVASAMFDYISETEDPTEDGLKDYLADKKEAGKIKRCGCNDPFFKLVQTDDGYKVNISDGSVSGLYVVTIKKDHFSFEYGSLSDMIEGYDEIQYNEYVE